ncbi:MAG: 50S ribosomal protein L22, partial [Planktomarina sp.]
WVGKKLIMKRGRPRARGRFGKIIKPFAELTILVRQVEDVTGEQA